MANGRMFRKCSVHRWCTRVSHDWCNPLETIPEDKEFVPSLQVRFPSHDDQKPTKGIKLVISLKKIKEAQSSSAAAKHGNKKRKASESILSHYAEKYTYTKLNKISTTRVTCPQAHQSAAATAA